MQVISIQQLTLQCVIRNLVSTSSSIQMFTRGASLTLRFTSFPSSHFPFATSSYNTWMRPASSHSFAFSRRSSATLAACASRPWPGTRHSSCPAHEHGSDGRPCRARWGQCRHSDARVDPCAAHGLSHVAQSSLFPAACTQTSSGRGLDWDAMDARRRRCTYAPQRCAC